MSGRIVPAGLAAIVVDDGPGEYRAAAIDSAGRPWHLFMERWGGIGQASRYGQILPARFRVMADNGRDGFVELESGESALIRLQKGQRFVEGEAVKVQIRAEARRDKIARVAIASPGHDQTGFDLWKSNLPGHDGLSIIEDRACLDAGFQEVLAETATLARGGAVHIQRTRAFIAADIDSASRQGRGSAGAKALSLNCEAVTEIARQVLCRGLGGTLVIDCPGPTGRTSGDKISDTLRAAFANMSTRQSRVLQMSAIDLLQATIEWTGCPIEDQVLDACGVPTAETQFLQLLRDARREAEAMPAQFFSLDLSPDIYTFYKQNRQLCDSVIQLCFGGRVQIGHREKMTPVLRRR